MRVLIVKFNSGSDPLYFVDGQRDETIESDNQLLDRIVGRKLKQLDRIWIRDVYDNDEVANAMDSLFFACREEDVYRTLQEYPDIEDN